jgi:hypothetical protein
MSDIAIRADHLSKLYHLGRAQQRHDTPSTRLRAAPPWGRTRLRDALVAAFATNPSTRLRTGSTNFTKG